jgi:hypothetical protein
MQTPPKHLVLLFKSKRGGCLYWAGGVRANNWPRRLCYQTMILVRNEEAK